MLFYWALLILYLNFWALVNDIVVISFISNFFK
jgi:hypothetical protein